MESKSQTENLYQINYDAALKHIRQNNLTEAKADLHAAGEALCKLIEITVGVDKESYKAKLRALIGILESVQKRLQEPIAQPTPSHPASTAEPASAPAAALAPDAQTPTVEAALKELDELEGLQGVKDTVAKYVNMVRVRQENLAAGRPLPPFSYHLVFAGNPGTGKTTVARIMAKIYCALGICQKPEVIEVSRADIVGKYQGHTAAQTREFCERARGGVLFLDEAYQLAQGGETDFGKEAINELLIEMENHRDELIVIAAGYTSLIPSFLEANPGLPSRFKTTIQFDDYNAEEMFNIFMGMCAKYCYTPTPAAKEKIEKTLTVLYDNRDANFANARDVRNLFETVFANQHNRLAVTAHTDADLGIFEAEDVP